MKAECVCGHSMDMHFGESEHCMDMINMDKPNPQGVQVFSCACKEYKQVEE